MDLWETRCEAGFNTNSPRQPWKQLPKDVLKGNELQLHIQFDTGKAELSFLSYSKAEDIWLDDYAGVPL